MKMKRLSYLLIFLLVIGLFTLSGDLSAGEKLSLARALEKGLENNFQVRIARRSADIAANNDNWGAAGRYPSLNLGMNFFNSYKDDPVTGSPGERQTYESHIVSPYVEMRWTLFNGFSISITRAKLARLNELSEGNAAIVVENTVQAIVLAYYKTLLEQEKLGIVEGLLKLSKDRHDYVRERKDVGAGSTYDVLQARIAWQKDTATLLLQQMNVKSALRSLNLVMGEPQEREYNLSEPFKADMKEYKLEDLLEKLKASNKTLKNQYINQVILKKDILLQRSGLFPLVSLNSGISRRGVRIDYSGVDPVDSASYDYYVNFSVSLNLFNGGNTRRAITNAKIQHRIGQLRLEEMEFSLRNYLRTAFELYDVRKQLFRVAEDRVASAKLNMEISTDKFKAGAINSFNYRDVQLLYLNTAFDKLQAVYDLIDSHSELMRLTGGVLSEY